jgi:entericidin B
MARKVLAVFMLLGMLGSLSAISGCNTVQGAGKDIERGGEKVQDAAKDVQKKM